MNHGICVMLDVNLAKILHDQNLTLEEYYHEAIS